MLDTAKEVWRTKSLPDNPLLGRYAAAANRAREAVLAEGLGKKADRLGHVFYMTEEFPEPCEIVQYRDYLTVYVLRSTLGDYCLEKGIDVNKVLKLVYREHLDYIHAEPIIGRSKWHMAGGNFVKSSDSRFKNLTGIGYPVPVHDRTEE